MSLLSKTHRMGSGLREREVGRCVVPARRVSVSVRSAVAVPNIKVRVAGGFCEPIWCTTTWLLLTCSRARGLRTAPCCSSQKATFDQDVQRSRSSGEASSRSSQNSDSVVRERTPKPDIQTRMAVIGNDLLTHSSVIELAQAERRSVEAQQALLAHSLASHAKHQHRAMWRDVSRLSSAAISHASSLCGDLELLEDWQHELLHLLLASAPDALRPRLLADISSLSFVRNALKGAIVAKHTETDALMGELRTLRADADDNRVAYMNSVSSNFDPASEHAVSQIYSRWTATKQQIRSVSDPAVEQAVSWIYSRNLNQLQAEVRRLELTRRIQAAQLLHVKAHLFTTAGSATLALDNLSLTNSVSSISALLSNPVVAPLSSSPSPVGAVPSSAPAPVTIAWTALRTVLQRRPSQIRSAASAIKIASMPYGGGGGNSEEEEAWWMLPTGTPTPSATPLAISSTPTPSATPPTTSSTATPSVTAVAAAYAAAAVAARAVLPPTSATTTPPSPLSSATTRPLVINKKPVQRSATRLFRPAPARLAASGLASVAVVNAISTASSSLPARLVATGLASITVADAISKLRVSSRSPP
jgi:hypothetical protein